jgi:hypothetical protein
MGVEDKLRRFGRSRGVRYAASLPERLVRSAEYSRRTYTHAALGTFSPARATLTDKLLDKL